jgi:hypothetical protein
MRGYTLPVVAMLSILAGCPAPNSRVVTRLNENATLTGDIPTDPLRWRVITSGVDSHDSTMYTLFGNDTAVQYSRTNGERNYPDGSVLSLVTWEQQEDMRWFGARIPAQPKSVEFVAVRVFGNGRPSYSYRNYQGTPLKERPALEGPANGRAEHVLSLRAAVMP